MAYKAKIIDAGGNTTGELGLPDELFGGAVNVPLMHEVVTAQLAAARSGTASTKTRSEVRGGGRKPWRQKGTGRARHGSSRSPIWVGGGTVFGPKPRKYVKKVNKKARRAALRSALSSKASDGRIWILEGWSEPRTKIARRALQTAGISGRALIVLDPRDSESEIVDRAFRNLPGAAMALYGSLAAYDVLVADHILFTSAAIDGFAAPTEEAAGEPAEGGARA